MSPSVMSIMRLTIRMAVVLPHPEGPTRTQISPAGTVRDRWSTALRSAPGYRLTASRNSSSAGSKTRNPRRSQSRGRSGLGVGGVLEGVVERLERVEAEGRGDEPVGEPGVLGQQRAVEIRADHGAPPHALVPRRAVVAMALQHAPERLLTGAQGRAAG